MSPDWAEITKRYRDKTISVSQLSREIGLSRQSIYAGVNKHERIVALMKNPAWKITRDYLGGRATILELSKKYDEAPLDICGIIRREYEKAFFIACEIQFIMIRFTARLSNILLRLGYETIGDIRGKEFEVCWKVSQSRNAGELVLVELKKFYSELNNP